LLKKRWLAGGIIAVLALVACGGGGSGSGSGVVPATAPGAPTAPLGDPGVRASVTSTIQDHSFESGGFTYWKQCGSVHSALISTAQHEAGSVSDLNGRTVKPEVNGTEGVCQQLVIPAGGVITFWVYEGTNDTITYVDQEADLLSTNNPTSVVKQLFKEAKTTGGWVKRSYDVSAYAGQTLWLYFGVKGNGYASDYVYQYVDNVAWASGGTSTPPPTATPVPTPTPTGGPTATPAPTPTPGQWPCNNTKFLSDQSKFANGTLSGDQEENVCGSVTQVLPEKLTASGHHGYYYVQMPSGYQIEIICNLDAMTTDPAVWPWVKVGDYSYVQGRYYYDNASSQGIDWTENDTGSWPTPGYVVINGNMYH
jgi:hypothetical protein